MTPSGQRICRFLASLAPAAALLLGAGAGCSSSSNDAGSSDETCSVGSERCACTQGGACDPGLECRSNRCVSAPGSGAGGKTGAGGSHAGGKPASAGGQAGTVPDASSPGPDAGAGGGPAADAAPEAEAGPSLPSCTKSSDCAATEVCAVKVDGTGICLQGSGKPCDAKDFCANSMGFEPLDGNAEGPFCQTAKDCRQEIDGHLNSVCVKESAGNCVPLCQYKDDPQTMKCVTHPGLGLNPECTRTQIRILSAEAVMFGCVDARIAQWTCKPSPRALTADEEWMLACVGKSVFGGGAICYPLNCFSGSGSPPEAKISFQHYLDMTDEFLDIRTEALPSGSGTSGQCSSDCDCGHCGYCESGTCRFGGEGPYGCYRGCG